MAQLVLVPVTKFAPDCAKHMPGVYGIFWELNPAEIETMTPEELQKLDRHVLFRRHICVN
jgi:hypothetical protein